MSADPGSECSFFSRLKMRNGTFKLTSPARFADLEPMLAAELAARPRPIRRVLDIGVSIGATTVEFEEFLRSRGIAARVTGTDLFVEAHLVKFGNSATVLADAHGWPLQYDVSGVVIRPWIRRLDYFTLAAIPRLLAQRLLRAPLRRRITAGETLPVKMQSASLVDRNVELVENDIFRKTSEFVGAFDFIRAANILNTGYFSEDRLRIAFENLRAYCSGPGALLLLTRTNNGRNDATLFELAANGRFLPVARAGKGSEVEDLLVRKD